MAAKEEIELLLEKLKKAPPSDWFKNIDESTAGIRAVLRLLNESEGALTAGKISEKMSVSTARVAVLLKKMVAKGLIKKENDPSDARIVVVKLSDEGRKTALKMRNRMYSRVGALIDKVGMEKMLEFVTISNEIHSAMKADDVDLDF